jgi:hypothetical protein
VAVRNAREGDIDGAVGLIMGQLARYHRLDPTFYRHPPDWDTERERLRAVLHEEGSICLAAGEEGTVRALLLANEIPRIPVYDPGGPVYFIQSLVARDGSWDTDGRALAVEAMRMMVERRAAMMGGFALSGDPERTALLEAVGLSVVTEFFREELIARVPD